MIDLNTLWYCNLEQLQIAASAGLLGYIEVDLNHQVLLSAVVRPWAVFGVVLVVHAVVGPVLAVLLVPQGVAGAAARVLLVRHLAAAAADHVLLVVGLVHGAVNARPVLVPAERGFAFISST